MNGENGSKTGETFALAISSYFDSLGRRKYRFSYSNINIPEEVIITKIRLWLKIQEKEYQNSFDLK